MAELRRINGLYCISVFQLELLRYLLQGRAVRVRNIRSWNCLRRWGLLAETGPPVVTPYGVETVQLYELEYRPALVDPARRSPPHPVYILEWIPTFLELDGRPGPERWGRRRR